MARNAKEILEDVLKEITPNEKERNLLSDALKRILISTDNVIGKTKLEKTIAGSFIRDTWLSDKKEIDLFILFPVTYSRTRLEKKGLEVGKSIMRKVGGRYEVAYAEHPYVRGRMGAFSVDIVPCYKVSSASNIKSAVDRTPFHNRYITRNLRPDMSGQVRLLKQFTKAADIYGSDIRTMGFSGYLCELLIIKYRSFLNLVRSAKWWGFGKFIDLENHCAYKDWRKKFGKEPLVVIDPTDPKRNVAAALSVSNFNKFIDKCRAFYNKPSKDFFRVKKIPLKRTELKEFLSERGTKIYVIRFKRPKVVDDILWAQKRKTMRRLKRLLEKHDFKVFGSAVWSDEKWSYIIFEMEKWELPPLQKVRGPPVSSEVHSKEFREKYGKKRAHAEGERWMAETKRKYRKAGNLLEKFLGEPENVLRKRGIRSKISEEIANGFSVLEGKSSERLIGREEGLSVFLKKYFGADVS